jgi:hypothetical protein
VQCDIWDGRERGSAQRKNGVERERSVAPAPTRLDATKRTINLDRGKKLAPVSLKWFSTVIPYDRGLYSIVRVALMPFLPLSYESQR